MLDDPLRGYITTGPEWREGGHVRGGGSSPCSPVVYGRMRERQRGRYCERTCEEQECKGQTHTIQVFLIVAESLVTADASRWYGT